MLGLNILDEEMVSVVIFFKKKGEKVGGGGETTVVNPLTLKIFFFSTGLGQVPKLREVNDTFQWEMWMWFEPSPFKSKPYFQIGLNMKARHKVALDIGWHCVSSGPYIDAL